MNELPSNNRELLVAIGIGQFAATGIIPYMQISPATTDPKAPQVITLVQYVQRALYNLGATDVAVSGYLDTATALALERLLGKNWEGLPWFSTVQAIIHAQKSGFRLTPHVVIDHAPVAVGGPLDFLPDVPGGLLTYAAVGYLLYRHFARSHR